MHPRKTTEPGSRTTLLRCLRPSDEVVTNDPKDAAILVELSLTGLKSRYVIGRGSSADIVVADPMISRQHMELIRTNNGWHVRDMGSKNGGLINNSIPVQDRPTPISHNDTIALGTAILLIAIASY